MVSARISFSFDFATTTFLRLHRTGIPAELQYTDEPEHPQDTDEPEVDRDDYRDIDFLSGTEGPADGNSVIGAEVVARKTHTTEIAFFRIHTVSFNFDKNTHGA